MRFRISRATDAVGRQRAKESSQVQKDVGDFLSLVDRLLLQAGLMGIFRTHATLPPVFISNAPVKVS